MGAQLEELIKAVLAHPEVRKAETREGLTLKVKIINLEMEVSLCATQQPSKAGPQPCD